MRLQLKDECQINNFFNEVKSYLHTNGRKMILGKGVTAGVKSLNQGKEMGSSTTNTPTDNLQ